MKQKKHFFRHLKWRVKRVLIRFLNGSGLGNILRKLLAHAPDLQPLDALRTTGYLAQTGWTRTALTENGLNKGCGYPIDRNGNPIPWITYPMISFLNERLRPKMTVFEYGSGQSTLYFVRKGLMVDSVENKPDWFKRTQEAAGKNARIHYVKEEDMTQYKTFIHSLKKTFHIIVIDGYPWKERTACLHEALKALRDDGVVLFDDSESPELRGMFLGMKKKGFKVIPFWGMRPVDKGLSCTSVFYRDNNCLGI